MKLITKKHGLEVVSHHAQSSKSGPHIVITGAVHGTEPCGPRAIESIKAAFEAGEVQLECGHLTMIPVCNPGALAVNKRFVDEDLNRRFYTKAEPESYEDHLTNILCPLIQEGDYVLDLHSHGCEGQPFAFMGFANDTEYGWATALRPRRLVYNFAKAVEQITGHKSSIISTPMFARQAGLKAALVECGQNGTLAADQFAYCAIMRTLAHFDVIKSDKVASVPDQNLIKLTHGCLSKGDAGRLLVDNVNFTSVREGQPVAEHAGGSIVKAPYDGFVVMPFQNPPAGKPWFYYGVEVSREKYFTEATPV